MPEIAEVETVRNTLKKRILNKEIININFLYEKVLDGDIDEFKKVLLNNQFVDINRRGKWLIFDLQSDHYLLSHLRMEGKYFILVSLLTIFFLISLVIIFNFKTVSFALTAITKSHL